MNAGTLVPACHGSEQPFTVNGRSAVIGNETYDEGDAFKHWVIFSQSESDASDGEAGYWSNELGWCSLELATNFDTQAVRLPITTNNDATMMMRHSLYQHDV